MKITVDRNSFIKAFNNSTRPKQFSRAALLALFEWFQDVEAVGAELDIEEVWDIVCHEFVEVEKSDIEEMKYWTEERFAESEIIVETADFVIYRH